MGQSFSIASLNKAAESILCDGVSLSFTSSLKGPLRDIMEFVASHGEEAVAESIIQSWRLSTKDKSYDKFPFALATVLLSDVFPVSQKVDDILAMTATNASEMRLGVYIRYLERVLKDAQPNDKSLPTDLRSIANSVLDQAAKAIVQRGRDIHGFSDQVEKNTKTYLEPSAPSRVFAYTSHFNVFCSKLDDSPSVAMATRILRAERAYPRSTSHIFFTSVLAAQVHDACLQAEEIGEPESVVSKVKGYLDAWSSLSLLPPSAEDMMFHPGIALTSPHSLMHLLASDDKEVEIAQIALSRDVFEGVHPKQAMFSPTLLNTMDEEEIENILEALDTKNLTGFQLGEESAYYLDNLFYEGFVAEKFEKDVVPPKYKRSTIARDFDL